MSVIEACSDKIAAALAREAQLDNYKRDLIAYSLKILLAMVSGWLILGVLSYLLGIVKYAFVILITMTVFKPATGGAHASSPGRCNFIGTLLIVALSYLTIYTMPYFGFTLQYGSVLFTAIMAFACFYRYAPADTPQKPITDPRQKKNLRLASFILTAVWFLVVGTGVTSNITFWPVLGSIYALVWHSFSVTPAGYRFAALLDGLAKKMKI